MVWWEWRSTTLSLLHFFSSDPLSHTMLRSLLVFVIALLLAVAQVRAGDRRREAPTLERQRTPLSAGSAMRPHSPPLFPARARAARQAGRRLSTPVYAHETLNVVPGASGDAGLGGRPVAGARPRSRLDSLTPSSPHPFPRPKTGTTTTMTPPTAPSAAARARPLFTDSVAATGSWATASASGSGCGLCPRSGATESCAATESGAAFFRE